MKKQEKETTKTRIILKDKTKDKFNNNNNNNNKRTILIKTQQ